MTPSHQQFSNCRYNLAKDSRGKHFRVVYYDIAGDATEAEEEFGIVYSLEVSCAGADQKIAVCSILGGIEDIPQVHVLERNENKLIRFAIPQEQSDEFTNLYNEDRALNEAKKLGVAEDESDDDADTFFYNSDSEEEEPDVDAASVRYAQNIDTHRTGTSSRGRRIVGNYASLLGRGGRRGGSSGKAAAAAAPKRKKRGGGGRRGKKKKQR